MSGEDASPGAEIGRMLEHAREEQGLSLKQAEQATKIRATYLRELERGNFAVLPPTYARGSLKTYANFLRLDGETLAQQLRRQQAYQPELQAPAHKGPAKGEEGRTAADAGSLSVAEDEEKVGDKAAGRLWRLVSTHITLGSFLGYVGLVAVLGLGLPLAVLATTLMEPDGEPVPMRPPAAGSEQDRGVRSQLQGKGDEPRAIEEGSNRPRDQVGEDNGERQARRGAKQPNDATTTAAGSSAVGSSPTPSASASATASPVATVVPTGPPASAGMSPAPSERLIGDGQAQTPLDVPTGGAEIFPGAVTTPTGRPPT
jgi:transcriptional regulator with XRE-family HTH domain